MSRRLAGYRPQPPADGMTVDYADVLRQAVENERWRVLRDVRRSLEAIATTKPSESRSYGTDDRRAEEFKRDALAALDRVERS